MSLQKYAFSKMYFCHVMKTWQGKSVRLLELMRMPGNVNSHLSKRAICAGNGELIIRSTASVRSIKCCFVSASNSRASYRYRIYNKQSRRERTARSNKQYGDVHTHGAVTVRKLSTRYNLKIVANSATPVTGYILRAKPERTTREVKTRR